MAVGNATMTTLQYAMKSKWDQKKIAEYTYPDSAFLGRIRKDLKFGGNDAKILIRYGRGQGRSAVMTTAQANISSSNDRVFTLTRAKDFAIGRIDGEAILAADGDENTLINGLDGEMKGNLYTLRRSLSCALYRNGGGYRSRIGSISTDTITLKEPSDIVHYEVDMWVVLSGNSGSAAGDTLRNAGARIRAIACDRDNGKVQFHAGVVATIAAAANDDYMFVEGDFKVMIKGLEFWLPDTAPTAGDNAFGVDRSLDTTRLGGVRFAATAGASKEETLIDCSARLGREGGTPDEVYLNNLDRAEIVKSMMGKAQFELTKSTDGVIGYKALILEGDKGPLKLMADPNCKKAKFFMLQLDTWVLKSLKAVPHVIDDDGNKMLREAANDGVEWRMRYIAQTGCEAPGWNATGTF